MNRALEEELENCHGLELQNKEYEIRLRNANNEIEAITVRQEEKEHEFKHLKALDYEKDQIIKQKELEIEVLKISSKSNEKTRFKSKRRINSSQ